MYTVPRVKEGKFCKKSLKLSENLTYITDNYKEKIADQEEKIANFEDRYYDKFTAMEVAMSKLTSQQNAISSLFG